MSETITLEEMVSQLGGTPAADPEPTPAADPAPATDTTPTSTEEPAAQPTAEPTEPQQTEPSADRSQQAFIHMRQQNKKFADTLKGIAGVLGVEGDTNDEQVLLTALQTKIAENEAKQNNVPVELYQRLKQLEERDQEYTALQKQQVVATGFETVKKQFGLTQDELNSFAEALVQGGKNPLQTDLNLVDEYKLLNYETLQQKAVASAIAAEQARATRASTQSTVPSTQTGKAPESGDQKVSSVRELEEFFRSNMA